MTLYLDTSSLVKLYVTEPGSDVARKLVDAATVVATSSIAYIWLYSPKLPAKPECATPVSRALTTRSIALRYRLAER